MDNPVPSSSTPLVPAKEPFKKWSECQKALKTLVAPMQHEEREAFVARISGSSQRHHIAFEALCLLLNVKLGSKLRWLEKPMLMVLSGGEDRPSLSPETVPSEARKWVLNELSEVDTLAHWKQFVDKGKHFWVLYAILRSVPNTHALVEALTALTECVERCQNTELSGKSTKRPVNASDAAWITRLLKSKIPAQPELPKTFLDSLFALHAVAALSESVRAESDGLRSRLKTTEEELAIETKAKANAEQREKALQAKLEATTQTLEETRKELSEEKLHTTRQGGFNVVARREMINHVLSVVRRGITHRLENIRGYADREKPNREEILALVGEIEEHIARLEEEVAQ